MPVDFQSIHKQVKQWGEHAPQTVLNLQQHRQEALECLAAYAGEHALLRARVERAAAENPGLRCAVPTNEALDAHFPRPPLPEAATVLAADGSQINPDRHAQVEFCVINVGAFEMVLGESQPPREIVETTLLGESELYTPNGLVSEEVVALRRDLEERKFLAKQAAKTPPPLVTLTDGPLELFRGRDAKDLPEFQKLFGEYLGVLDQLAQDGAVTAGYVDKPAGDLVVRLLELAQMPLDELRQAGKKRPWAGVTDASLFRDLLAPGDRSAVFEIQSTSAETFRDHLALHFFYLNVGRPGRPWIARVEAPAWVAHDLEAVERLHAVLLYQSQMLGNRPYPYALHRAHEVAVVSFAEKEQLEGMLVAELIRRGLPFGEKSYKQAHKDSAGRTRHTL